MKTNEITNYNKNKKQQILKLIQDSKDFEYNKIVEYCNELNITVEPQRELHTTIDNKGYRILDSYNFTNIENFKKALNENKLTTENNFYFDYEDKLVFTIDEANNVFKVGLKTDVLFSDLFYLFNKDHLLEKTLNNLDY